VSRLKAAGFYAFPFRGKVGRGVGCTSRLFPATKTHPHPNPPLEREGASAGNIHRPHPHPSPPLEREGVTAAIARFATAA